VAAKSVISIVGFGLFLLVLATFAVAGLSLAGYGSLIKQPIPTITGVSQFAVFYLMAQLVERIVELFSDFSGFGASQKGYSAAGAAAQDPLQQARTISLWFFASALGVILSYLTVGLFQMVGVVFAGSGGHAVDAWLSGVIIGGGTKPLHDLIGYLQAKNP